MSKADKFYQTDQEINENEKEFYAQVEEKIDLGEWDRAGGECICLICTEPYYKHRNLIGKFSWLTIVCDGHLVKL